jgi:hypothetical protein
MLTLPVLLERTAMPFFALAYIVALVVVLANDKGDGDYSQFVT